MITIWIKPKFKIMNTSKWPVIKLLLLLLALLLPLLAYSAASPVPIQESIDLNSSNIQSSTTPSTTVKYVSDKLVIVIRSGASKKHKVIKAVSSGVKLEVSETKGKFVHVKTSKGIEGWTLSQFLVDKPISKHRLSALQIRFDKQKEQLNQLRKDSKTLRKENRALKSQTKKLSAAQSNAEQELQKVKEIAANPLKLTDENQVLTQQTMSMESEIEILQQELQLLKEDNDQQWFMTGAGVVVLGIVIGLTMSRLRRRRKTDWGSL